MSNSEPAIPTQPRLPLRVAASVVGEGIRIRLGRSLVTLSGVALGIAFLMATLTAQALRRGVAAEDRLRETANRRYAGLVSETGPLAGHKLSLVVTGALSPAERKLLQRIDADAPSDFELAPGNSLERGILSREPRVADPKRFTEGARAVVVLGTGPLPAFDWPAMLAGSNQPVVAFAAERAGAIPAPPHSVALAVKPSPAELSARAADERRARARTLWIVVISLLVTVMGIANSMLMSVTERFRDIGTMRCLGALSSFVRTLFLLEAALIGLVGGIVGALAGAGVTLLAHLIPYGPALLARAFGAEAGFLALAALASATAGLLLSMLAALYPAALAARRVPADALRSNV